MDEMFARGWEQLLGRIGGPLSLRFVLQPCVAAALAIRAGLRDAREGRPPYLWTVLTGAEQRRSLLLSGWQDAGKVFIVAAILDTVYQLYMFRWFYPVQTLMVAPVLALLPYALLRGPVSRLARGRSAIRRRV
jgi:hypothetical protein